MNPWTLNALRLLQDLIRFALWAALIINAGMAAIFSIWFVGHFLWSLSGWAQRVLFSNPW